MPACRCPVAMMLGFVLAACGPGQGTGQTAGETDTGSESGSSTGTGSTGGSTDGSSAGSSTGASCEGFEDDASLGDPVEVTIRNEGTETLYLGVNYYCLDSVLEILDPGGEAIEWRSVGWTLTCETLMGGDYQCGGPGCSTSVIQIEPGGYWTETWPGYVFEPATLPDGCWDGADLACGPGCVILREPDAGEWTFQVTAATQANCYSGPCACDQPVENGACIVYDFDWIELLDAQTVPVSVVYPGAAAVEIAVP